MYVIEYDIQSSLYIESTLKDICGMYGQVIEDLQRRALVTGIIHLQGGFSTTIKVFAYQGSKIFVVQ